MNKYEIRLDQALAKATRLKAILANTDLVMVKTTIRDLRNTLQSIKKQSLKCGFTREEINESLQEFIPSIPRWNPHSKKLNPKWNVKWNCLRPLKGV